MTPPPRLEPLAERHLDDVEALIADPDVLRHTRIPEPPPPGFAHDWLKRYEVKRRDGTAEVFAAIDEDDDSFLGLGMAPEIDREAGEVELGYIVASAARGRGVATEILKQLTRWAFEELEAQRLTLLIDVENPASERVAERAGYAREGVRPSGRRRGSRAGSLRGRCRRPANPCAAGPRTRRSTRCT